MQNIEPVAQSYAIKHDHKIFGVIHTLHIQGKKWYIAKEIAWALDYIEARDAIRQADDDEVKTASFAELNNINGLDVTIPPTGWIIVSEPGVFQILARSNKPNAKPFQKWLYNEVLPSIVNTGSYTFGVDKAKAITEINSLAITYVTDTMRLAAAFNIPIHVLQIEVVKSVKRDLGVDFSNYLTLSGNTNNILPKDRYLEVTEICKLLSGTTWNAVKLNKFLKSQGLQEKIGGEWKATEKGAIHSSQHSWTRGAKSGYNLKWNVEYITKLIS